MFRHLPLELVQPNPDQPRKHFDDDELAELAASIAELGLMQPITVREVDRDPERFLIVAGERRWRAHYLAGLPTISAQIIEFGHLDEVEAYVLSVAENVNRSDMTTLEETGAYVQLRAYGLSVADIARRFGKTETYIEIRLSFDDLIDEAKALLTRGEIGPDLARWVAALQPGNQRTVVNRWARGEFRHGLEAAAFARELRAGEGEVGFFELETTTAEQRQAHRVKADAARRSLDRADALATLLRDIARTPPAELAAILGDQLAARSEQLDTIAQHAHAATRAIARARLHAKTREVVVTPEAHA